MESEDHLVIDYNIILPNRQNVFLRFAFNRESMKTVDPLPENLPAWTRLEFQQCPHCPLNPDKSPHCPLVARLVRVIEHFNEAMSYETIQVEIRTERRTISKQTAVQDVLSAILGLIIPTSGCPHTAFFRPMARFHLPLADTEETIYRATSMYLLAQYFRIKQGKSAELDFKGLKTIYQNMQTLNAAIAERLRTATHTDSSVNAIILLDMFTMALPFALEESLEDIELLFAPYLKGK